MNPNRLMRTLSLLLLIASLGSSCLKTRAQLRSDRSDEEEAERKPTPAHVQNVEPQGGYAFEEMKAELARLNGRIEDLERAQRQGGAQAASAQKEEAKKLENRIVELEQAQANMIETIRKLQESAPAAADPVEVLNKAKKLFEEEDFELAIDTFSSYLKAPKAKKVEEATFLRAESYFKLKQYKKAIVDYSKFPEKYTKSERMPAALLRIGQSFDGLGMKEDAKGFYQELLEKFPKSAEAKKIKKKR